MMKMMMKSKISKDVKIIFGTSISTSHWVRKIQIKTDPNIDNQIIHHSSGMVFFFVFWGTLLFHIWPPSLYWPQQLVFWDEKDFGQERFNMTR